MGLICKYGGRECDGCGFCEREFKREDYEDDYEGFFDEEEPEEK